MQRIDPQAVFTSRNVQRQQEDVHAKKTHLLTTSFLRGKPRPFHIHYRCSVLYKELSRPVRRKEMGMFFRGRSGTTPDGMRNLSFWRLMASHRIKHNDCATAHSSGFLVKHPNLKENIRPEVETLKLWTFCWLLSLQETNKRGVGGGGGAGWDADDRKADRNNNSPGFRILFKKNWYKCHGWRGWVSKITGMKEKWDAVYSREKVNAPVWNYCIKINLAGGH